MFFRSGSGHQEHSTAFGFGGFSNFDFLRADLSNVGRDWAGVTPALFCARLGLTQPNTSYTQTTLLIFNLCPSKKAEIKDTSP